MIMLATQFTPQTVLGDGLGHMHGWEWSMFGIGWLVMAAILVGAVAMMVSAIRGPGVRGDVTRDALELRYVRGEITREDYLRIREDLGR